MLIIKILNIHIYLYKVYLFWKKKKKIYIYTNFDSVYLHNNHKPFLVNVFLNNYENHRD